ncbi:MAG TPA: MmcQ/YjbR family DNA-binding protein [Dyadobacter sp.]|nr:MmcQ/YjbR family DNA-binding protein [Dyadobacter sp.]
MLFFTSPYLEFIRQTALALPGVKEKLCFDTPAFYVSDKLFARFKEDGETLVLNSTERDKWINEDPETFFITAHYERSKYLLVALANIQPGLLQKLLSDAWRNRAPVRLRKEFDQEQSAHQE